MKGFLAPKDAVLAWLRTLGQDTAVFFPQPLGDASFAFQRVRAGSVLALEDFHSPADQKPFRASACVQPPGKHLAPAREELFRFHRNEAGAYELTPTLVTEERILAGVRPCDLKAIHLMDQVNRAGTPDPYYLTRRDTTTLIAHDCLQPCDEHCFCDAAGSLYWREGADIFLTPQPGGELLIECLTPRGEQLAEAAGFPPCDKLDTRKAHAEAQRAKPFGRQFGGPLDEVMRAVADTWDSPVWDKHVERCFSCGTCNLVCPTCFCFDVEDDFDIEDPASGNRCRSWDGCMLTDFAEVSGGHNFRPRAAARQRHRVKRKFAYLPGDFDAGSFCVGCGRCGHQCTVDIDIFDIANDLLAAAGKRP